MTPEQIQTLVASSPLAWITLNEAVNENQQPIEFKDHRFMIDFYADDSPDIVSKKSAQVGFSVAAILKSMHEARFRGQNIIYALPTNNVVQDFVKPKVNPLITSNAFISRDVADDSVSLKKVGNRFMYFKGGFSDREAISISGDVLVIDEYDRMPDMGVVTTFDSRLQASKNPKRWRFSNPSQVGFGVDALYTDSDQRHWFVTCACGHEWFMDWEPDGKCHYVDRERGIYACGGCNKEITDEQRRMGRWVAKYKDRKRHGYWFSQMMAPWVTARRIIEQYEESNIEFFHNFVLGKAYTPSDLIVNRETILRACAPSIIPKVGVSIGVDQNVNEQIWVAMTSQGVFAHGKAQSWEEIERLKLMWNAVMVVDPQPYQTMPKKLAEKYNNFYLCRFKEIHTLNILDWKGKTVWADRTKLLDTVANEITNAALMFRERPSELEDYIADWQNIYRTTEEKDDGKIKSVWKKKENKESDFSFATAYARVGLSRVLGRTGGVLEPELEKDTKVTDAILEDGRTRSTLTDMVRETFEDMEL